MEEFSVIKGFENYKVNREGTVIDIRRNKVMRKMIFNGRYVVSLYSKTKKRMCVKAVAVLVANAFVQGKGNFVKHIDGNNFNDNADNLYYSNTAADNEKPVINLTTGIIYNSMKEAAKALHVTTSTISKACKYASTGYNFQGNKFVLLSTYKNLMR